MSVDNLLLLPGMMCDARMWAAQIRSLDCKTSVPDLSRHDSFEAMASAVLEDAPDEFAIAGLSMGGILALELWRQAPDRITHLALLDTNPFAEEPERQSIRLKQIEQVLAGGLRELAVDSLEPLSLAAANREDDRLLNTIVDMATHLGPNAYRNQSLVLSHRVDSTATLREIDCPTVVVCGVEDVLFPILCRA